jgi:hypothetical protein
MLQISMMRTLINPKIAYWQLAILCICFYVLLPFALTNNIAAFTLVVNRNMWLRTIIIAAIVLFALWPLFIGIVLAIAVSSLLVYCTVKCLKRMDVSPVATVSIWSLGALISVALVISLPPEK